MKRKHAIRSGSAVIISAVLAALATGCGTSDTGASDTGTSNTAAGAGGAGGAPEQGGSGGAAEHEWDALILGTLATTDLAKAEATQNALAKGGQHQANALGDFAHFAMLGTTILGTTEDQYLAFDRWHQNDMNDLYDNASFKKGFASFFAKPPELLEFERQETWEHWGDVDAGESASEYWFVVIRGTQRDPKTAQATHDAAVGAARATANHLGDVAHRIYLGQDDPSQTLFIDVWVKSDAIADFYSNPDLQKSFAKLFSDPPTLGVYSSTDWYQW